ncbi:DNA polymerase III subunit beta [Chengkuizengella axinellae]|uniref:Beta sliding clamp n=1 Tax=Chengkuizengella axinellae TaxID=3064388 RepID=A0ABT9J382_9BACL|nr:DNA polymerase III subunit beta [Chengkuizengella sp. 2205SS18-9]MDP5276082.1 DNA polymerase III subunit beta [Chengkuizengella sp. 2205SS18-9]
MEFKILKNKLHESIQHVSKAITNRTTIPILSGIKIDAYDQEVILTASDTEISIQSFIPKEIEDNPVIEIIREGNVVLPAKFFVEIIRKLPGEYVEIKVDSSFQTTIKSGTSELQIIGLDPEEYPVLPSIEENNSIMLASDLLKSMIKQTSFSISTNESTPILTGILWNLSNKNLKFVATDRHRLASREISNIEVSEDLNLGNIVISGKTLNELNKLLPDQNQMIHIVFANNQVLFKIDSILFYTRILDGIYPDTSKIIPQTFKTEIIVPTKLFLEAIDRAYLLSRENQTNIVKMIIRDHEEIEITSSLTSLGKITEQVKAERIDGELIQISFNSKYMLDALKVIDSENIQIGITGTMSPIIIKPSEDTNMLHLILPYRTTN